MTIPSHYYEIYLKSGRTINLTAQTVYESKDGKRILFANAGSWSMDGEIPVNIEWEPFAEFNRSEMEGYKKLYT